MLTPADRAHRGKDYDEFDRGAQLSPFIPPDSDGGATVTTIAANDPAAITPAASLVPLVTIFRPPVPGLGLPPLVPGLGLDTVPQSSNHCAQSEGRVWRLDKQK